MVPPRHERAGGGKVRKSKKKLPWNWLELGKLRAIKLYHPPVIEPCLIWNGERYECHQVVIHGAEKGKIIEPMSIEEMFKEIKYDNN